jgi:hypothetical protein
VIVADRDPTLDLHLDKVRIGLQTICPRALTCDSVRPVVRLWGPAPPCCRAVYHGPVGRNGASQPELAYVDRYDTSGHGIVTKGRHDALRRGTGTLEGAVLGVRVDHQRLTDARWVLDPPVSE